MRNFMILAVAGALLACAQAPAQQTAVAPAATNSADAIRSAVETIQPVDFFARIGFLASDALGGRDTPSPGLEVAALYIESEFRSMGLAPAGDPGSYIQRWPYTVRGLDVPGTQFTVAINGAEQKLAYGAEYYAQAGQRGAFTGGIVFVGERIPFGANDRGMLRNRAVMVRPAATLSNQELNRLRATADSAGAGALIVVTAGGSADAMASAASMMERRPAGSIPVFFLREDRARRLFADAGLAAAALTSATPTARPLPLAGATATLGAAQLETVHQVPNVAGMLRGSDPALRDSYVVFSAHIDHVGSNCGGTTPTDRICNGADDDASGTSAIMELAEAFAALPVAPRRSIIFLGVSGEEKGLLGSRHYADNPTVPIESIVANVNIDMIGRNNPDSVVVIGKTYSSLGPLLERVNAAHPELGMTTSDDLWPEQRFFFRSDHFNFARREVPAIFFFTGTHEDYHRATDHVEKIDLDKITRITRLIFHYALAIANDTERPVWDPAGLEEVRRLTSQGR